MLDDAALLGIAIDDDGDIDDDRNDYEVWYECRHVWRVFELCNTQWRTSMEGITGLDYNVVFSVMNAKGYSGKKQLAVLDEIKSIEHGVLDAYRERKEQRRK